MDRSPGSEEDEGTRTTAEPSQAVDPAETPAAVEHAAPVTRGFLFADLRGYTAYVEARGDAAASALLDVYRALVRATLAGHGGAEIKTEGDSFYVVFPSASSAVACGLAIVTAAAEKTAADPERPIRVGVGIHAGESVEGSEGYVGSAVNIAARVCAQAAAGEVLVTETVRSLTRTSGRLVFTSRGRRRLKGIAEPIALYRVDPAGTPTAVSAPGAFRRADRRLLVALGGAGVMLAAIVVAVSGGFGRTPPSPSGTAGAALPSPSPEVVERIVYTAIGAPLAGGEAECNQFLEGRLALVPPTGGEQVRLTRGSDVWETHAAWSPDGTHVAFIAIDQADQASLWVMAADGTDERNLLPAGPPQGIYASAERASRPSWSADGARLLFTYGNGGLWVVGLDGSDLHRVLAPPPGPVQPTPDANGNVEAIPAPEFGAAAWMPDGRIVVEYTPAADDAKGAPPVTSLYRAAADGSGPAPIAGLPANLSLREPAPSSDGRLAFVGQAPGSPDDPPPPTEVYVFDPAAGAARKLPGTTDIASAPAWSPDGAKLVFGHGDLYTIGADGTGLTKLGGVAGQAACWPSWGRTTRAALPTPTASPAPGASPPVALFHRGALNPGTYETTIFEPHTRFTVAGGWVALIDYIDAIGLGRPGTPFGEIDVGRIQVVSETPCLGSPNRLIGPTARDFVGFLQGHPFLTTTDPKPVIVGGKRGLAIDVEVTRALVPADCPNSPLPPDHPVWTHEYLFEVGKESVWLRVHDRVRIVSIDVVDGPAVTFIIESSPDDYDAFLPIAQRIIDSLDFP